MLPSWSVNDTVRPKVKPPHWMNARAMLVDSVVFSFCRWKVENVRSVP